MPPAKRKAAAKGREAAKKQAVACAEDSIPHRDASDEPEDNAL